MLALWAGLCPYAPEARAATNTNHLVFAHYMVCFADYGASIAGYTQDIQDAQAAGIDGFALDVGAWSGPDTYYKSRVELIYEAAEQLGTNFKLFFCSELGSTNDIVNMVSTYAPRTNSFRYQGKVVLSSYGQAQLDWAGSVFAPLQQAGINIFFIPHFWPNPVQELPSYQDGVNILNTYSNILDGLFLFGAAGLPYQLAQCNSNYTTAVHQAGKIFMASYTPHYWGCNQYSLARRYFEFKGGAGTVLEWQSIIQNQPDWVDIVTWNDFNESTYVSPVDTAGTYEPSVYPPTRFTHKGFLELSKHYITWFKTGSEPPINQDALFYFYRTHSWWAHPWNPGEVTVAWCIGDLEDMIYLTTFLTSPAELHVTSGTNQTVSIVSNSVQSVDIPFSAGIQRFELWRSGSPLLKLSGPMITNNVEYWDCFPATGFGYAGQDTTAPGRLRIASATNPTGSTAAAGTSTTNAWWVMDDAVTNGQGIVTIPDRSGNGFSLNPYNSPSLNVSDPSANGHNTVGMNGSLLWNHTLTNGPQAEVIVVLYYYSGQPVNSFVLSDNESLATSTNKLYMETGGSDGFEACQLGSVGFAGSFGYVNRWEVLDFVIASGQTPQYYVQTVDNNASSSVAAAYFPGLVFGGNDNHYGYSNIKLAEALVLNTPFTPLQRYNWFCSLTNKYNIPP